MKTIIGLFTLGTLLGIASPDARISNAVEQTLVDGGQIVAAPLAERRQCAGYCVACVGQGGHAAGTGGSTCDDGQCTGQDANEGDGWHLDCKYPSNCSGHICNPDFAVMESAALDSDSLLRLVNDALLVDDMQALESLMVSNPERVRINPARAAVQVLACDGQIAAHYPVTPTVITTLLE